ncbi:hypothetical protein D3C81_2265140 [compost metagenome]
MPPMLPKVLNSPAVTPPACRGAASAMTAQPSEAKPLPKKANAMIAMTIQGKDT